MFGDTTESPLTKCHFSLEKTAKIILVPKDATFPECCYNKVKSGKQEGELHVDEVLPVPSRSINNDHLGHFIKVKREFNMCWLLYVPLANTQSLSQREIQGRVL